MKNFYLIGESTKRSFSPIIHDWIYKFLNIEADYSTKDIQNSNFNDSIKNILDDIKANNINGINITNPYKTRIISPAISMSEDAKKINAINCIYNKNNELIGDNTDWYGFLKSLEYHNINLKDYNIVVIGVGGGSRSIVYSLQHKGIDSFQIYNRTNIDDFDINSISYEILSNNDIKDNILTDLLVINCITPDAFDNNQISLDGIYENIKIFYDLNYHQSKIHSILKDKDVQVIDGLDMLIYQAIKSIELWCNEEIIGKINIKDIKKYLMESQ